MPGKTPKYDHCKACKKELKVNANFPMKLCDQCDTPANRERFSNES